MESAAKCGAEYIRLFTGWTPAEEISEEIWLRMTDAFTKCSDLAQKLNVQLSIETHGVLEKCDRGFRHVHSASTRRDMVQRMTASLPENIGFNYDPGNLKPFGDFLLDIINCKINYCHLKDWKKTGEDQWTACAVGDDDLDYFELLSKMKYKGPLLIEYEPLHDQIEGIARSLKYLRKISSGVQKSVPVL